MLPHGIPQRKSAVCLGKGFCRIRQGALLQRHTEQRLGLHHHEPRPVREDTAVAGTAATDIAGGAGHGGGKSGGAPLAGQGCVTRHAEGIGEAQVQPDGQAGEGGARDKVKDGRRGGLQADGYRPPLRGRVAPVQEPDIQHPARPRGGAGQLGGQPEGTEPTVRHPHHSGADGKGLGGDVPVGHDHQQLADGAVPAVQVPPPEGAGKAGHPMLRRMGGDIRQEDDGLRVQRDEQHRAEGTLPLLHQGAGAGGVLQRDNRLPHGGGCRRGQTGQERGAAQHTAHPRPGVFHQTADGVRKDGRCYSAGQAAAVGNGGEGEDAHRHRLRPEDGAGHAHDRPRL